MPYLLGVHRQPPPDELSMVNAQPVPDWMAERAGVFDSSYADRAVATIVRKLQSLGLF